MNLEAHLESLPERDARDFGRIVRLLKAQPEVEPSPGLHERIAARLPRRGRLPKAWWWVPVAASLAILLSQVSLFQRASDGGGDTRWLADNQEADGTWDPARHGGVEAFRPALTALSLLALRQHPKAYPQEIAKGVSALERMQTADGAFGGHDGQARLYNLAIATYALAICGADSSALAQAIAHIGMCQAPDGSWAYAGTQEGNVAVTAWMTRALASAETCGNTDASVPLRKGLRWLRNHVRDDGRMAYHPSSAPSDTLTALSACSLIEAGKLFPDVQALGIRMTDALNVHAAAPDSYRDYAKIIAFESAGKTVSAESVRTQVRQRRHDASQDQWRVAGGQLYMVALRTLCRVQ